MHRILLFIASLSFLLSPVLAQDDLRNYKMAGPYEVVARDGEFRASRGGSERDMWTAYECARLGYTDKALEIINAYATTLQRFDGHDAPLCAIQGYWLVRAMTTLNEELKMKSEELAAAKAMVRRAILPGISPKDVQSTLIGLGMDHT